MNFTDNSSYLYFLYFLLKLCLLGQDKTHFFQVEKLLLNKGDIIYGSFPNFLCDGLGGGRVGVIFLA